MSVRKLDVLSLDDILLFFNKTNPMRLYIYDKKVIKVI